MKSPEIRLRAGVAAGLTVLVAGALAGSAPALAQTNVRAWNEHGQTWIVWVDDQTHPPHGTYDIYVSDIAITDIAQGTQLGRLLQEDWDASRLQLESPGGTWTIPDGAGGTYTLASNEGVFVHTPHVAAPKHFSVVKRGNTAVGANNSVGPVSQALDPVTCHEQFAGTTSLGYDYKVWALWIDGRADHTDRRPDIDVMGNLLTHGTAHLFTVYEPLGGRPPGLLPAVLQLHGGGGNLTNWRPGEISTVDNEVPGGFAVAVDSNIHIARQILSFQFVEAFNPWWFGHWENFNRFVVPTGPPPNGSLVVDYSMRRNGYIIDWLVANYPVDPDRVSVLGHSMGAGGSTFMARRWPDKIAAAIPFEHAHSGQVGNVSDLIGTRAQNLPTTLPGGVGVTDFYKPATTLPGLPDPGPTTYIWGKNDTILVWQLDLNGNDVPARMAEMDAARIGAVADWDQRTHTRGDWGPEHWTGSSRYSAATLSQFRVIDSFPAITGDDYDPAPGRQNDPGNGDPADGDDVGTWGGHVDWDRATVEDTASAWAATLWLRGLDAFANDNAPVASAPMDVTVRRASGFVPGAAASLFWTVRDEPGGALRESGSLTVPADGVVTVSGITVTRDPDRVRVRVTPAADADSDGQDAQIDCDESNGTVWATPGETIDLLFDAVGAGGSTLSWTAPLDPGGGAGSVRYDTLRTADPADFDGTATCVETDDGTDTQATDATVPPAGGVFYYASRARNDCPSGGVGSIGASSSGQPRTARSCP